MEEDLAGKFIDRYQILEKIGEGGMAVVYKALDTRLKREVAVKLIRIENFPPSILDQMLKRFEREATALGRLSHPNIVTVHDFGEYKQEPYLVMEYLPGGTLRQRIGEPIPYMQAAALLKPVVEALAYAHAKEIVHRDVKPINILFSETGIPKLSDFGIARLLGMDDTTRLTGTGMGVGTPAYMAPEQWRGRASPAVDVYAVGVVFYELLTGHVPYQADTPADLLVMIATEPLPDPRLVVPDLPEEGITILRRSLQPKPENRYQTMDEFAQALGVLGGFQPGMESTILQTPTPETDHPDYIHTPPLDSVITASTPPPPKAIARQKASRSSGNIPYVYAAPASRRTWILPMAIGLLLLTVVVITSVIWTVQQQSAVAAETAMARAAGSQTAAAALAVRQTADAHAGTSTAVFALPTLVMTPNAQTEDAGRTIGELAADAPRRGSTMVSSQDGMVMAFIPGGTFEMGSTLEVYEQPVHTVTLSSFWMDTTEVTNAMYAKCVSAGECSEPKSTASNSRYSYYGNNLYTDYPVIYVSWAQASEYCAWAGRELPTEAQWEYAARGGLEGMRYPWGEEDPVCTTGAVNGAQFYDCSLNETGVVSNFAPNGYGLFDMAGNVWEWTADWFAKYPTGSVTDPTGPASGVERVLRGGSWYSKIGELHSTYRGHIGPSAKFADNGFRCTQLP